MTRELYQLCGRRERERREREKGGGGERKKGRGETGKRETETAEHPVQSSKLEIARKGAALHDIIGLGLRYVCTLAIESMKPSEIDK